jgi:hypothetical protein
MNGAFLGLGKSGGRELLGKIEVALGEYQLGYEFYELQVDCERPPSFVDY